MAVVAGRNRVNRPYFFKNADGSRMEVPAFGFGQGDLEGMALREFNMYVTAKQIDIATAEAPDAFVVGNWSVEATETGATVTISALPDGNGINITGIAIRVDEDEVTIVDPELGDYPLVLAAGTYDIDIAAISGAGQSAWSDVKSVEVAE